ncbi:extracellular solute-binding protein [Paenibacillus sp. GYB004]|uniref:extracellular solute-binding protein n=1 Tax=Paenibacillus sp. GYB004 TaxID=2994393 RepID=UPI002F967D5E
MRAGSKKYAKLLHDLKLGIMSGEMKEGEYIPSENTIAEQYGLSRPTVRKAVAELAGEGLIRTIAGKGSVVLALGDSPGNRKVTLLNLYWMLPSYEYPMIEEIVGRFNREHAHIQVRLVPFSSEITPLVYAGYKQQDMQELKPDLISISNRFLFELEAEKIEAVLQPLTDLHLETGNDIYDFLWKPARRGGQLFAVPVSFSPVMLVYNRSMFEEGGLDVPDGGWTWDDFVQAAVRLSRQIDDSTVQYGFALSPSFYRWPLFFMQEGGQFARSGKAFPPLNGAGEAGIQFILDLIYKHRAAPLLHTASDLSEQIFQQGKVGMILSTYYLCTLYRECRFDWGVCKFPAGRHDRSLAISTNIGIGKGCENVHEARYFIQYLLSTPIQALVKERSTTIPAVRTVAESAEYPHSAFAGSGYESFRETLGDIQLVNDLGLTCEQVTKLSRAMEMVWFRTETFEQVWKSLAREYG